MANIHKEDIECVKNAWIVDNDAVEGPSELAEEEVHKSNTGHERQKSWTCG